MIFNTPQQRENRKQVIQQYKFVLHSMELHGADTADLYVEKMANVVALDRWENKRTIPNCEMYEV